MKNIFIILLTFLYVNSYSQVKDSFKTSNYPSNPQWNGDITEWFVNANEQLQTKNQPPINRFTFQPQTHCP